MKKILTITTLLAVITLCTLLSGCGSDGTGSAVSGNQETGKIALQLVWDTGSKSTAKEVLSAPTGVGTVRVKVTAIDITSTIQYDFAAGTGSGTIDGILAGTGRTVTAQGLDLYGNVTYQGVVSDITVQAGQTTTVGPVTMIPAPTSAFTFTPLSPTIGQTVTFTDTSAGTPTSWAWSFGDGTTSTSQNPTHTYATAGTFTVSLAATNGIGTNSSSQTVTVVPNSYSIAGKVTLNGTGLAGVTIALTGGKTTTTDSSGNYTFTGISTGNYTLTPSSSGYSFTPSTLAVIVSNANLTGKNLTATNNGSIIITW